MVLSAADKARFKILYMDLTNAEMSVVFGVHVERIYEIAKELGIFEDDRIKKRRLEYKKTTP